MEKQQLPLLLKYDECDLKKYMEKALNKTVPLPLLIMLPQ